MDIKNQDANFFLIDQQLEDFKPILETSEDEPKTKALAKFKMILPPGN